METRGRGCDPEVGKFHQTLLRREDIRTLDIAMNDTLLVKVEETMEHLGHV